MRTDDEHITHGDIHASLEENRALFEAKHNTLVKWLAVVIVSVVGATMTQIVSVAASLAEIDGTQELVLQSLDRLDRRVEKQDQRIQEESREAEEDLRAHRQEFHP